MTQNVVTPGSDKLELDDWVVKAVSWVKREPVNIEARLELCKLYSLQADWDRALQQLSTVVKIEPEAQRQAELFKNLILSERLREAVLCGEREARSLEGELPDWVQQLQRANRLYASGKESEGQSSRLRALENAPARGGHSEALGTFEWLADGDDRLGPVCEFICAGGYRWIPFAEMNALEVKAPAGVTDIVWAPATLTLDKPVHGFIPARYPITARSDCQFKTGLQTQWQLQGQDRYWGTGRKMWISSVGECSLFEGGKITFDAVKNEQ